MIQNRMFHKCAILIFSLIQLGAIQAMMLDPWVLYIEPAQGCEKEKTCVDRFSPLNPSRAQQLTAKVPDKELKQKEEQTPEFVRLYEKHVGPFDLNEMIVCAEQGLNVAEYCKELEAKEDASIVAEIFKVLKNGCEDAAQVLVESDFAQKQNFALQNIKKLAGKQLAAVLRHKRNRRKKLEKRKKAKAVAFKDGSKMDGANPE